MNITPEERLKLLREAGGILYSDQELELFPVFNSMADALRFQKLTEDEQKEILKNVKVGGAAGKYGAENLVKIRIDDETMDPAPGPNDSILVAFRADPDDGDPAIVQVENSGRGLMIRRIRNRGDGFLDLIPLNDKYPPETVSQEGLLVLGLAASVDRSLE